jgi:integrase
MTTGFSIPKYRRHKASGQAFVQVKGCRQYLGKYGTPKSKELYARVIAELAVRPAAVLPATLAAKPTDLTIVELAAAHLDFAETYYRKNGQPTRSIEEVKAAIQILTGLYGRMSAAEFGPLRLLAIQSALAEGGLARSYVNKLVGYIKRIFKWGVSREMVPASVHTAISTVEGLKKGRTTAAEPEPVKPVADDIVEATLPQLPRIVADMVQFQRLTGCRPGEVCQLRPMDVDRSGKVWEYRPASHKTDYRGRERVIFTASGNGGCTQNTRWTFWRLVLPCRPCTAYAPCPQDLESDHQKLKVSSQSNGGDDKMREDHPKLDVR